jgi:Putative Flp pilus-assembly TadE/G-like
MNRWRTAAAGDPGSTIPLILGMFLVALILVAGSVAASDAFVQQNRLQDLCDGAAVAAGSAADLNGNRTEASSTTERFLILGAVQTAVQNYRDRDAQRADVTMVADVSIDLTAVTVRCTQTSTIAFGAMFGYGDGVTHTATSAAQGSVRT